MKGSGAACHSMKQWCPVQGVPGKVPEIPQRRSIQVGRAAANLVWTPGKALDLTRELGIGRVH